MKGGDLVVQLGLKPKGKGAGAPEPEDDSGESESESDEMAAAAAFLDAAKGDDPNALLEAFHNLMGACGY